MSHIQLVDFNSIKFSPLMSARGKLKQNSKTPVGPWEKTVQIAKKIFITTCVFLGTLIGNTFCFFIPAAIGLRSFLKNRSVNTEVEARRIEHLSTALHCGLEGSAKWKFQKEEVTHSQLWGSLTAFTDDTKRFIHAVIQLRDQIAKLDLHRQEHRVSLHSVESVYKKFQRLANDIRHMAVFQSLEKIDHPAVNFLKLLSAKFRSAKMSDILVEHAKDQLGDVKPDQESGYSIGKTGEALVLFRTEPSFKQNFFWAISHPFAWRHSWESQWLQKKYDSNKSNPTYTIHEIEYTTKNQKKLSARFTAGPTPFNDSVYQNIFLKEGHELRYNIMDTSKSHEHEWIEKMDHIAAQSKGHLEHVVLGFVTKEKRGYLEASELDSLIDGYQKVLLNGNSCRSIQSHKTDNGVVIPETLLSNEQISQACSHAKALIQELNPDLSGKETRHAALVMVDTMMALGTLINYLENLKNVMDDEAVDEDMRAVYIATACKQCFDRGPVYLAALLIFFRSLTNSGSLTQEEFYRIAGLPLFRAPLNEGREQQKAKFEVYEELAKMLGPHMDVLSRHTRSFRSTLV